MLSAVEVLEVFHNWPSVSRVRLFADDVADPMALYDAHASVVVSGRRGVVEVHRPLTSGGAISNYCDLAAARDKAAQLKGPRELWEVAGLGACAVGVRPCTVSGNPYSTLQPPIALVLSFQPRLPCWVLFDGPLGA